MAHEHARQGAGKQAGRRSIRDVRTAAGLQGAGVERHKAYMRVGSLELERTRNERQRDAALKQAADCQRRCESLQQQIEQILSTIELREPKAMPPKPSDTESFKITY